MSERTFRAVVAAVLVGALGLAAIVVFVNLPSNPPSPSATPGATAEASPSSSAIPTTPGPALAAVEVVGVGTIPRGSSSGTTLVLRFTEPKADAIPDAPGSFRLALSDAEGDGSTVSFAGTPSVDAPGSLGATARLVAPNVLMVSIQASDVFNIEPLMIRGLGIRATATAAPGQLVLQAGEFTGSLGGGLALGTVPSPGAIATQ